MTNDEQKHDPFDLDADQRVARGYVHSHTVSTSWHHSMDQLMAYDLANAGRVWASGGPVAIKCGTDGLVDARNLGVEQFLAHSRANWLWWTDTDMGFAPDAVDQLLAAADPVERPVMGGLCFSQIERSEDGMGGWKCTAAPTIMKWERVGKRAGYVVQFDYPRDTVFKCDGTGAACILVHRSAFERIAAHRPTPDSPPVGPHWYTRIPNRTSGQLFSEDLSFCIRAAAAGMPIYVHTGVQTTHHKSFWIGQDEYWMQRAVNPPPVAADPAAQQMFDEGLLDHAYFEAAGLV